MRIGVDIDGVLANFDQAFATRCVSVTGRDLFPPEPFDRRSWEWPQFYGYTDVELSAVWSSIKGDPFFWRGLPTYPDTEAMLRTLDDRIRFGDDVYFITARPGVLAKQQTEEWLRIHWPMAHLQFPFTVLISADKAGCAKALDLDAYIDDRDVNAEQVSLARNFPQLNPWYEEHTKVFLVDRPWNQNAQDHAYHLIRIEHPADMFVVLRNAEHKLDRSPATKAA